MSKLDELIQEYCPNGVEYKKVEEICDILDSQRKPISKDKRIKGIFPYYGANGIQDYINDYLFNGSFLLVGEDGSVINKNNTPVLNLVTGKIWVNNHAHILKNKDNCLLRYVYYILQTIDISMIVRGTPPKLTLSNLKNIKIPVPPIPVQKEIVRILDNFTDYTEKLKAELDVEIVARKKQYEYYRDKLLTFDVLPGGTNAVKQMAVGDVATVTKLAGFEFTKYVTYSDTGKVIALRGLNVKNGRLDLTNVKYIDNSDLAKLSRSKLYIGDMLFTYVGTIGQVALISENDKYYLAPNVALIRCDKNTILPEYMLYYFQSNYFISKQINKYLQSSSMQILLWRI